MCSSRYRIVSRFTVQSTTAVAALVMLLLYTRAADGAVRTGEPFPDLSGRTSDGRTVRLADYRGKVVLIDFWATWCGPCRKEMPNIVDAYDRFNSQGFEVIGVSLDEDLSALQNFKPVRGRPMPWPSVCDGSGWQSPLLQQFGITGIPAAFLIDRDGRLISTDAKGEALHALVQQALTIPQQAAAPPVKSRPAPTPVRAVAAAKSAAASRTPVVGPRGVSRTAIPTATPSANVTALARAISRLAEAAPGAEPALERQVAAAIAADRRGAAQAVWSLIDSSSPDRQLAGTGRRLLAPVLDPPTDATVLDVAAWAAYSSGDAVEAYLLQAKAVAAGTSHPLTLGPNRELDPGLHIRAALYELANGQGETARQRFTTVVRKITGAFPAASRPSDTKYLYLFQSKLATEPAGTLPSAPSAMPPKESAGL